MIPAKICGITRLEDAMRAVELGAAAVGFIFYEKSARYVHPQIAARICERVPEHIPRVGVFANPALDEMLSTLAIVGLTHVQLCGEESAELCRLSPLPVIKSVRRTAMLALGEFSASAFLVDSEIKGAYGGTGITSDWDFCRDLRDQRFTILAGGIGAHNVQQAIAHAHPDAVDLCSSVEKSPGVKDHQKLRTFFRTLESIEYNHGRLTDGFLTIS